MSVRDLLSVLRRGGRPDADALRAFARGLANGDVSDAQAGAFAMAVCTGRGLGEVGRVALTEAMAESGDRLHWDLPGPIVDKHSTGGVGDPVSLILAPALAALNFYVPMISGRGLGHTGGTLDKLEAVPGLRVDLDTDMMRRVVGDTGCAIVSANADITPADKRLYAVRDATSTVDQIDLIVASILSKKLAAGLDALVLDVKCGSGAFMRDRDAAHALAQSLVTTATGAGLSCAALITDMNQPLAPAMGNAVEISAVLDTLRAGHADSRLARVCAELGGALLALTGQADGAAQVAGAIADGRAFERFAAMVTAQGGPSDFAEAPRRHLPIAPVQRDVRATRGGSIAAMDGTAMGHAVVDLGGGRARDGDTIDPSVGLSKIASLGTAVEPGMRLARLHARSEADADRAESSLRAAIIIADDPPDTAPLILERIG